jgi:hypothetical protein
MGRRVLVIVMVLVVALFVYLGYNSYDAKSAGLSGDVFPRDSSMSKSRTAESSQPATPSSEQTVVYPAPAVQTVPVTPETTQAQNDATIAQGQMAQGQVAQDGTSAGDTISPNPPNGMVFAGKGKYQLYRQGNLTWRLNTETGQSCIIFATDEEWKKPKVYRAGCGSR